MKIMRIKFPEYATFFNQPRSDDKSQMQFCAVVQMPDGRTLRLIPEGPIPTEGFAVKIRPGRVLFEGMKNALATCFYVKQEVEPKKTEPKKVKVCTGRFVGGESNEPVKAVRLTGEQHPTAEMIAALRTQRQLAGLEEPRRGVAVHIVKKRAGGKKG